MTLQQHSLDTVVGLHGAQSSIVKHGHDEALGQVIQVLTEG